MKNVFFFVLFQRVTRVCAACSCWNYLRAKSAAEITNQKAQKVVSCRGGVENVYSRHPQHDTLPRRDVRAAPAPAGNARIMNFA